MIDNFKGMFKTVVPKREAYEKEIKQLIAKKTGKEGYAALIKRAAPDRADLYNNAMREIALLNLKIDDKIDEYNRFVAKENAVQKAFDRLNGFDK